MESCTLSTLGTSALWLTVHNLLPAHWLKSWWNEKLQCCGKDTEIGPFIPNLLKSNRCFPNVLPSEKHSSLLEQLSRFQQQSMPLWVVARRYLEHVSLPKHRCLGQNHTRVSCGSASTFAYDEPTGLVLLNTDLQAGVGFPFVFRAVLTAVEKVLRQYKVSFRHLYFLSKLGGSTLLYAAPCNNHHTAQHKLYKIYNDN